MYLDNTVRLIARWLQHEKYGINALAMSLPRERADGTLDPPMEPVTIENDSDHESVAANLSPSGTDGIVVWGDSSQDVKVRGAPEYQIARQVAIAIAYVTTDNVDVLSATRRCAYLMRAGIGSLGKFNQQRLSEDFRTLNGIHLEQVQRVREQRVTGALGNVRIWGFLIVEVIVLETLSPQD